MSPKKNKGGSLKKGFNLSRDSVYVADPTTDLCIQGGLTLLPEEESGDLDTEADDKVLVDDRRRLIAPLSEGFIAAIDHAGVRTPILIAKIDDVAVVIDGKSRVRAARLSNLRRAKDGRPPIKVKCVVQRDTSKVSIVGTMIEANNARRDDSLVDRIEKLRYFLSVGGSEADAAIHFNVAPKTITGWLDFDDHATNETKKSAQEGRLSASAAAELAKIYDPDAQRAALEKMLSSGGVKERSARAVRRLVTGQGNEDKVATDRKSQVALLKHINETRSSEDEGGYWDGVLHTLALVTGRAADLDIKMNSELIKLLKKTRAMSQKEKKKKKQANSVQSGEEEEGGKDDGTDEQEDSESES